MHLKMASDLCRAFSLGFSVSTWMSRLRRDDIPQCFGVCHHWYSCGFSLLLLWGYLIYSIEFTRSVLYWNENKIILILILALRQTLKAANMSVFIVRRAGLLLSQQDFEWRWSVPLFQCLTVLEFSFILFDLCLLITFFNFIMNYVPIVTFWIFTYHKIWILSIMFCFIWSYWIIYFLACL